MLVLFKELRKNWADNEKYCTYAVDCKSALHIYNFLPQQCLSSATSYSYSGSLKLCCSKNLKVFHAHFGNLTEIPVINHQHCHNLHEDYKRTILSKNLLYVFEILKDTVNVCRPCWLTANKSTTIPAKTKSEHERDHCENLAGLPVVSSE